MRFIGKHIFDFPILIRGQVADSTGVAAPADGRVLQSTTGGKVIGLLVLFQRELVLQASLQSGLARQH